MQVEFLVSLSQALVLVGIALSITLVAEVLTVRATVGVASAGHYSREFVEPKIRSCLPDAEPRFRPRAQGAGHGHSSRHVDARFGQRLLGPVNHVRGSDCRSSRSLVRRRPLHRQRRVAQCHPSCQRDTSGGGLAWLLWWTAKHGARHVGAAWQAVRAREDSSPSAVYWLPAGKATVTWCPAMLQRPRLRDIAGF